MFRRFTDNVYTTGSYSALLQVNIFPRNFLSQGDVSNSIQTNANINLHLEVERKQQTNKTKAV